MMKLAPALFSFALLTTSGCAIDAVDEDGPTKDLPTVHGNLDQPSDEAAIVPLVADMCDEPTFAGVGWVTSTSDHFTLSYLPGTAADTDQTEIARRLETAYTNIRTSLGITAEPQLFVNLSPSRNAAVEHDRGFGRAWADAGRYDVIYTGAYDSYEMRRYGQMLTLMLDYEIDPNNRYRLPVLSVGVAEYLDQSGRDMHTSYARQLAAGVESRVRVAELDSRDLNGRNPGRSGSLVKVLVDRYGMETFLDIYKATAITWNSSYGCSWHAGYGCITTSDQLTSVLDGILLGQTGDHWSDIQPDWEAAVEGALEAMPLGMAPLPTIEIGNVLRVMDDAINTNNAAQYRSTIEGFYCDWGGDATRSEISSRAVNAYDQSRTLLLGLYDTGIKNFWTAQAFVMRTDSTSIPVFQTIQFEHVPAGWRVSYSPDWY